VALEVESDVLEVLVVVDVVLLCAVPALFPPPGVGVVLGTFGGRLEVFSDRRKFDWPELPGVLVLGEGVVVGVPVGGAVVVCVVVVAGVVLGVCARRAGGAAGELCCSAA
jgi:hypothetical protein